MSALLVVLDHETAADWLSYSWQVRLSDTVALEVVIHVSQCCHSSCSHVSPAICAAPRITLVRLQWKNFILTARSNRTLILCSNSLGKELVYLAVVTIVFRPCNWVTPWLYWRWLKVISIVTLVQFIDNLGYHFVFFFIFLASFDALEESGDQTRLSRGYPVVSQKLHWLSITTVITIATYTVVSASV